MTHSSFMQTVNPGPAMADLNAGHNLRGRKLHLHICISQTVFSCRMCWGGTDQDHALLIIRTTTTVQLAAMDCANS